jgi:FKBP-type peptidyl-prolyl cis-trans isomerase FkpA
MFYHARPMIKLICSAVLLFPLNFSFADDAGSDAETSQKAITTPSGLTLTTLAEGSGPYPSAKDTVRVHYHGTLLDGTVFDSSVDRGEAISFPLSRVIRCWTEGVQMIRVGGKARLVCPPHIAYGDAGAGSVIPGGATLIFDVELLGIE